MGEGVADTAGHVIGAAAFTDRNAEPPPDPAAAPHGWTWDRGEKRWRPSRQSPRRGPRAARRGAAFAVGDDGQAQQLPAGDSQGDRDPDPPWMGAQGGDGRRKLRFEDVPRQVADDIAGLAGLVGTPILAMLQAIDPYCGTVLAQSFEGIVDATLPLICRSEKIVAYFTGDKSDWLLWGKLAMALAPAGRAIAEHHIMRTVEVVRDPATGRTEVRRRSRGEPEHGDHLVPPPAPEFQYAA